METDNNQVARTHEMEKSMTEKFKDILSENEYNYIKSTVTNKNIPSIFL